MLNELTSHALSVTGVLLQGLVITRLAKTSPDAAMTMTKLDEFTEIPTPSVCQRDDSAMNGGASCSLRRIILQYVS